MSRRCARRPTCLLRVVATVNPPTMSTTFAVPAAMAKVFPKAIDDILKRDHEVAAEGLFHEDVSQLALEEERARMQAATEILSEIIGSRPAGSRAGRGSRRRGEGSWQDSGWRSRESIRAASQRSRRVSGAGSRRCGVNRRWE